LELLAKRPLKQTIDLSQPKTIIHDDHVVPDLEPKKEINECDEEKENFIIENTINLVNKIEQQHILNDTDKISETSSDSGQGQSEILLINHDFDSSDSCLNISNADNTSNFSDTKENDCENNKTEEIDNNQQSNNDNNDNIQQLAHPVKEIECVLNQIVPVKEESSSKKTATSTTTTTTTTTTTAKLVTSTSTNNKNISSTSTKKSTKNSKLISNSDKRPNGETLKKKDLPPSSPLNPKTKQDSNNNNNNNNNKSKNVEESSEVSVKSPNETDTSTYEDLVAYEFNFPRKFCGILIGKNGVNVDTIRSQTHTQIGVRNDPKCEELQIVCVSGRLKDVDHALDILNMRFPAKQYPQISFKPITKPIVYRRYNPEKISADNRFNETKVLVAPNMFVEITTLLSTKIINEINANTNEKIEDTKSINKNNTKKNNVHVTAVVGASHIFIQIPSHPTYENLQKLDENMSSLYNNLVVGDNNNTIPFMVEPIEYGTICVAPTSYGWHRAMVTNYQSYDDTCKEMPDYNENCGLATIKFLDYGGYLTLPVNQLRQLRYRREI
jgi:A-kinase anchor protein 1, mitochondrial